MEKDSRTLRSKSPRNCGADPVRIIRSGYECYLLLKPWIKQRDYLRFQFRPSRVQVGCREDGYLSVTQMESWGDISQGTSRIVVIRYESNLEHIDLATMIGSAIP